MTILLTQVGPSGDFRANVAGSQICSRGRTEVEALRALIQTAALEGVSLRGARIERQGQRDLWAEAMR